MIKPRIAVIGAGISGLAVGRLLAQNGFKVTIFERFENVTSVGAGLLLQPLGLKVLSMMGLLDEVWESGSKIDSMLGTNQKGRLIMDIRYRDLNAEDDRFLCGLGVHRSNLFNILYSAAIQAGVNLRTNFEVESISRMEGSRGSTYSIVGKQLTENDFDAVIIANGTQSTLRKYLNVSQNCDPYPWGALWAILPNIVGQYSDCLEQRYSGSSMMAGVLPTGLSPETGEPCLSFFWSIKVDLYANWRESSLSDWKQSVLEFEPSYASILENFNSHDDLAYAQYADVRMNRWNDGGIVCLGDAAHGMSPQLGLGANLSLIDAFELSNCIDQISILPDAFSEYSRRRRRHLRYYHRASRWLTPLFQSDSLIAGTFRDLTFPHMNKFPYVYHQALRTISGVKTGIVFDRSLYEL